MRPLLSNSRELSDQHWAKQNIPLQGFVCFFMQEGQLHKKHIFITAPSTAKDHWEFTRDGLKEVLKYLLPVIGSRKILHFLADGSTKQVNLINSDAYNI